MERFEAIKAWQEARLLVKMIYDAGRSNSSFNSDYRFRAQVQGASVSVMSNPVK